MTVRRLEGPELAGYDVVPRALAQRVLVVEVPWLPAGASGMTLGRWILLRRGRDRDRTGHDPLLAHELAHVGQFADEGALRFLFTYLGDYARGVVRTRSHRQAYLDVGHEQRARQAASAWHQRRVTSAPAPG